MYLSGTKQFMVTPYFLKPPPPARITPKVMNVSKLDTYYITCKGVLMKQKSSKSSMRRVLNEILFSQLNSCHLKLCTSTNERGTTANVIPPYQWDILPIIYLYLNLLYCEHPSTRTVNHIYFIWISEVRIESLQIPFAKLTDTKRFKTQLKERERTSFFVSNAEKHNYKSLISI